VRAGGGARVPEKKSGAPRRGIMAPDATSGVLPTARLKMPWISNPSDRDCNALMGYPTLRPMLSPPITAAILYDVVHCPHRVALDAFGDPSQRDSISPFVQLLWERRSAFEIQVVAGGLNIPFLDLSKLEDTERKARTLEAMRDGETLIYGGRIAADGLLGVPDLLRKSSGGYMPGDIKSGSGEEVAGDEESDGKPKKHYAVQLALYVDILERFGLSAGRRAFVWDVHGKEVVYDLEAPLGPHTTESLWDFYQAALDQARHPCPPHQSQGCLYQHLQALPLAQPLPQRAHRGRRPHAHPRPRAEGAR
jgi:hypothetical protein